MVVKTFEGVIAPRSENESDIRNARQLRGEIKQIMAGEI
jgi:hypothetical protein